MISEKNLGYFEGEGYRKIFDEARKSNDLKFSFFKHHSSKQIRYCISVYFGKTHKECDRHVNSSGI